MAVLSAVCAMGAGSMVSMADEDVTKGNLVCIKTGGWAD